MQIQITLSSIPRKKNWIEKIQLKHHHFLSQIHEQEKISRSTLGKKKRNTTLNNANETNLGKIDKSVKK